MCMQAIGVFTITLPKNYSVLAGFRYENTRITGDPKTPYASGENSAGIKAFYASYNTYVPSLTVQKVFGSNTFKLSYSKRITKAKPAGIKPIHQQN
jgi:hypothetical protein